MNVKSLVIWASGMLLVGAGCVSTQSPVPKPDIQVQKVEATSVDVEPSVYKDIVTVRTVALGADAEAQALATYIERDIRGKLSKEIARVSRDVADYQIHIGLELETVDQSGEYRTMNADMSLEMTDASGANLEGAKNVRLRGERKLGREAVRQFEQKATEEATAWLKSTVETLILEQLGASTVSVRFVPVPANAVVPNEFDLAYVEAIGEAIRNLPFHEVTNLGWDAASRTCRFRVTYFMADFPTMGTLKTGISNALQHVRNSVYKDNRIVKTNADDK